MVSKLCLDWWRNYTADNTALQFANYSQYAQYSRWTSQYIELLHHSLLVFRALPFIPRFLVTVLRKAEEENAEIDGDDDDDEQVGMGGSKDLGSDDDEDGDKKSGDEGKSSEDEQ